MKNANYRDELANVIDPDAFAQVRPEGLDNATQAQENAYAIADRIIAADLETIKLTAAPFSPDQIPSLNNYYEDLSSLL